MANAITIPSPSLFLDSAAQQSPAIHHSHAKQNASTLKPSDGAAVTKRKQSKSRNGCVTCKAKRLKCDETKPTCQQCTRRSVVCGGYKKDFKWRPFEEASFVGKPASSKQKKSACTQSPRHESFNTIQATPWPITPPISTIAESPEAVRAHPVQEPHQTAFLPNSASSDSAVSNVFDHSLNSPYPPLDGMFVAPQSSQYMLTPHSTTTTDGFERSPADSAMFDPDTVDSRPAKTTAPSSVSSGQSPRLVDLLLPGTDLSAQPEEYMSYRSQLPDSFFQPVSYTPNTETMGEDDVEEIPRDFSHVHDSWAIRLPSPTPSNSSSSSSESLHFQLLNQPHFSLSSPEMLTRRFDRDTCGILSVKDGPTENPWRTLVWPLARDCPALYHAIASMTSFHQSKDSPQLRLQGIDHMRSAVHALASNMERIQVDAAISTTLVLAFAESWDQHISTGINHIKGAKILIDRALTLNPIPIQQDERNRLQFLCNTWIYMDVIARLTSWNADQSNDFDTVTEMLSAFETDTQLDPLMGCAKTLFPIIGRVANLVRRVRHAESNSPSIISQALQLKTQLENWDPPAFIEDPEDETTSPHDSRSTAIAYQYATLLYLHQAVPEIPSASSAELADKVLRELATVAPRSRAVIVQIYPLMAAGCEATDKETREWVQNRWNMMSSRMKIGIIDRCAEVTKEVWSRREKFNAQGTKCDRTPDDDTFASHSLKRESALISDEPEDNFCWLPFGSKRRVLSGPADHDPPRSVLIKSEPAESRKSSEPTMEVLRPELTVRGSLHWLGVMKDWQWEILLG